jgi:outer membrane protein assembly factor BamB
MTPQRRRDRGTERRRDVETGVSPSLNPSVPPSLRLAVTWSIFVLLTLATLLRADVTVPGETGSSLRRIQAVDKAIAGGEVNDALEELQRILDEAGDDLVPLTPRGSVRARRLCHARIAALPAEARKAYRDKVEERARKWLEQGQTQRDPALLRKVVDEAFCSRSGEQALNMLGDLAFECGDFDAAERWWRFIVLPVGEDAKGMDALVFPDPEVDVARVRVKQLLARLYRGERDGFAARIKAFATAHPKAAGNLAGRSGPYAETLQALLAAPAPAGADWPTFAGAVSRNRNLGEAPGRPNWRLPRPGPTWVRRLDGRAIPRDGAPAPVGSAQTLAFHPIIVGDQVFVADARYIRAFNLLTGEVQIWFDLAADGGVRNLDLSLRLPAAAGASYTLSAEGDRLFARMGWQSIDSKPAADAPARKRDTYLVCIDRLKPRRKLWMEKAREGEAILEFFEGAPLVFDGRAFAAAVRFEGGGAITAVACHDVETGALRWKQPVDVCDVQGADEGKGRTRQHLLTRAGSRVVYASHSGAVVALEAETGRRVWAARYPSRGRLTDDARPSPRELAPPVYAAGRVFVAPLDYGRVLCLDADTGKLLWESEPPIEVVHLLGVAGDQLLVTTPDGIRGLSIETGRSRRDWMQPGDGSQLPPFGRGLLAAGWVYWPTAHGLRVLEQTTGEPVDDAAAPFNYVANEIRGNLVAAHGCLIVADTERLTAFIPARQFLEQRREESKATPESAASRVRLAVAEADAGQHVAALKDLSQLEKDASAEDRFAGVPIRTLARSLRQDVLRARAETDRAAGNAAAAAAALTRAAGPEFAFDDRVSALTARAFLWEQAAQPEQAVAAWQDLLAACAGERAQAGAGFPARAQASRHAHDAARHIDRLLREHGRKLYEPIERQAQALLDKADNVPDRFEEVAARYPNSEAALSALGLVARSSEGTAYATHAYRRKLARATTRPGRAPLLVRLGDWYRKNGFAIAARETYLLAARDHRDYMLKELGFDRDFIAEILKLDDPLHRAELARPTVTLPLMRGWEFGLAAGERIVVPKGPAEDGYLFCVRGPKSVLICRDVATGKPRWEREMAYAVTWLAEYADLVIAVGASGACGLRLHDGSIAWESAGNKVADLRLAAGRLFYFEDQRRLVALDAGTGERLWTSWAPAARLRLPEPAGRFHHHYFADARRVLVQVASGNGWLIDADTGRVVREVPGSEPWPRDPVPLDTRRVCIVQDLTTLVILDEIDGKEISRHTTRKPSLTAAAPRLVADVNGVLALSDGWVLERFDPAAREPQWVQGDPDWLSRRPGDEPALALDADTVYLVTNDTLHAFHRLDGKECWDHALPVGGGPWKVIRTRDHVVVYPTGGARPRPPALLGGYLLALPSSTAARPFPVLFLDPADGSPVQRLNFMQDTAPASVQFLGASAVVNIAGKAHGLQPRGKK